MNRLTPMGARILTQALVRSFVDQSPAAESENEWVARALRLQQQLGRILGVTPSHYGLEELITTYEEVQSVEAGTHPDIVRNNTYTVDNTLALTEHLMYRLNQETTALLDHAHFGKVSA